MKPHRFFINLISHIIPRRFRSDWKQEWEAELMHRESRLQHWRRSPWKARSDLLRRSLASVWDALALQPRRLEDDMVQDLRFAIRLLIKEKGFTTIAIIVLAAGIGLNTAVFSLVNAVLLKPLPYAEPDRLVRLFETTPSLSNSPVSPLNFIDWKDQNRAFDRLAAYRGELFTLVTAEGAQQIPGMRVSADFFSTLGIEAFRGRIFVPQEDQPAAARVVVLSHTLWTTQFGGDPEIVGGQLTMGSEPFQVIGVLPASFSFGPSEVGLWTPIRLGDESRDMQRTERYLQVVGRLSAGLTLENAQKEMNALAARLAAEYPDANQNNGAKVVPLQETFVGETLRTSLWILLGAVGFVLLIACSNFANLLLARSAVRRREIEIRRALGASRLRIVRQCMTETALLALLGAGAGLLVAHWAIAAVIPMLRAASFPFAALRLQTIGLDNNVLAFSVAIAFVTAIAAGLIPAVRSTRRDSVSALKGARGETAGMSQVRARNALVIAQVSLTLVLLVGAGLLVRSLWRLLDVDLGFDRRGLLTMEVSPATADWASFYRNVTAQLQSIPGVTNASFVTSLPLLGEQLLTRFTIENRQPASAGDVPSVSYRVMGPGFLQTMRVPLLRGRHFTEQDVTSVVVNETLARQFWPGADPVGSRIRRGGLDSTQPWITVVGVVQDMKVNGPGSEPRPEIYIPHALFTLPGMSLVVRTARDPLAFEAAVRAQVRALDNGAIITRVRTMEDVFSGTVASRRLNMVLLASFSIVALLLACAGIYGVMAYAVTRRAHEIGIRMALGARRGTVFGLVVWQGLRLAVAGVGLGLVGVVILTRWMNSLLFGVSPTDPATLITIVFLIFGVALLACYVPARRATHVDPLVALRHE